MTKTDPTLSDLPTEPVAEEVLEIIERAFMQQACGDDYLAGIQMAVPGVGMVYGVKVPVLRKMADEVVRAYKKDSNALRLIALDCWGRGSREHQLLALFMLAKLKLEPAERWELGVRFLPDVENWESCDQLCAALLGEALANDPVYMDIIEGWVEEDNFWIRRAALVTPVYLRRANYSEQVSLDLDRRTLALCEVLLDDGEKYIRKAVDWSIRQVIARQYDLARDWMLTQATAQPSRTARATLKLAAKKLTESDREILLTSLG
jgi:3-methyladenine DNA glycosylase AlkD